jgi:TIR domain
MSDAFPVELDYFIASVARTLRGQGSTREISVLANATPSLRTVQFDPGGGVPTVWDLILAVDPNVYANLTQQSSGSILLCESKICSTGNVILAQFGAYGLNAVLVAPRVVEATGWRDDLNRHLEEIKAKEKAKFAELFRVPTSDDVDPLVAEPQPPETTDVLFQSPQPLKELEPPSMPNPIPQPLQPQSPSQPKRIFLSHKGADKPRVEAYYDTLKLLGFDPWLDREDMPVGTVLERGLHKGMEESCAVVFFITPNFKDENFLETEITYALHQRRKKGEKNFAIIMIVFKDGEKTGKVPSILEPYVWGNPGGELEALHAILKALPVKVGPVG